MNSKEATFAIYRNREEIKVALHSFTKLGFHKSALHVFQSKLDGSKDFSNVAKYQFKNGATIGAIFGAVLVGGFFMFVDLTLVGNQWVMIVVGIIVGGFFGVAGGTLVGIGTPDPAGKRYGQYLQSGGILLSVHSESPKQIQEAKKILAATGGQDIQLINEIKTWDKAYLERINLEKIQDEGTLEL